jgi:hypothetical protein
MPITKENSNDGSQPPSSPEAEQFATSIVAYNTLKQERDDLQKQLDKMQQNLTVFKIENEQLRAQLTIERERNVTYQHDIDEIKDVASGFQALFIGIMAQMRAFQIEHAPLVKDKPTP